jgi:bidirectional [NiFe] hydrogenase diaphorase subunit
VWNIKGRGATSETVVEMNRAWGDAKDCTHCGKCVAVCPTGALVEKGFAVSEMVKDATAIVHLTDKRGGGPQ